MNAELIEHIEAYLEGRMTKAELDRQAQAAGETNLEASIDWVRNSRTAIELAGLREQLKETVESHAVATSEQPRIRTLRFVLAAAASVLLILSVWWMAQPDGAAARYSRYEFVDPGLPVLMSQSDDYLLYNALTYYSEENYAQAATELLQIRDQYAGNDTLSYYLGASLLYQDQPQKARPYLEEVIAQPDAAFQQRAEWLLVLAAVKEADRLAAQPLLERILADAQHEFYAQAKALEGEWEE